MANMEFSMQLTQRMEQRPTPSLIMFAALLALPNLELEQTMRLELTDNPALEMIELDICLRCSSARNDGVCYFCLEQAQQGTDRESLDNRTANNDDVFDLFSVVAAPRTLAEDLTELAHLAIPNADHFIAEFLIGGLKDNGMLDSQIGDAVRLFAITPQRVREVLSILQRIGPPGTFARDTQECMLLQLERLEIAGANTVLARPIIENHLKDLAKARYANIARALETTIDEVMTTRDFIRKHLRPFPMLGQRESEGEQVSTVGYTSPDVVIRKDDNIVDEFTIEIVESRRFALRVSPIYRDMNQALRSGNPNGLTDEEGKHVLDHVVRAQQFMAHLRERRSTLERVAICTVKHQKAYLTKGVRYLTELTRVSIADELNLHVSTVSRAISDKYMLLPEQQVKPMRIFFEVVRGIQDVLREIVSREDHPLTDLELAVCLTKQGYSVARRTVTKYRQQLGILSSNLR
jgi:RNA polymerase sigma-54 factor